MHIRNEKIVSIEYVGEEECCDLSVRNQNHCNYVANRGFIVHNSRPGPLHCISGDTIVYDSDLCRFITIKEAYDGQIKKTLSLLPNGSIGLSEVDRVEYTGKQLINIIKAGGHLIKATDEHRFMTIDGEWVMAKDLHIGDEILVTNRPMNEFKLVNESGHFENYEHITIAIGRKIETKRRYGPIDTYDMSVKKIHNYIANGFIVHNTGNSELITKAKKSGTRKDWGHDLMNEITSSTYGYSVFQEQVLRIMAEVGGMNYMDVAAIRNAMSKSYGDEFFNRYRDIFNEGAMRLQGFDEGFCNEIFDHVSTFGCLAEEVKVPLIDSRNLHRKISISELYNMWINGGLPFSRMPSLHLDGTCMVPNDIVSIVYSGRKPVLELVTVHNKKIRATADHQFMTQYGWKTLGEIDISKDWVCGVSREFVHWEKIDRITSAGEVDTFDIGMRSPRNSFQAAGLVVHNSWSFNKAHSVGYSILSYATAYMKAHYPRTFYKVLCNHEDQKDDKVKALLREYINKGYGRVLPPKINKSGVLWKVDGDDLRAGLATVIPEGAANEIVAVYPVESESDLQSKTTRRKVNSRVWGLIDQHKLFDPDDSYDPLGLYAFAERMGFVTDRTHKIVDVGYAYDFREVVIAGVLDRQINLKTLTELKETAKLKDWTKRFDESAGENWAIAYLRDESGPIINCHIKNYLYPKVKDMIWSKKVGEDILVMRGSIPPSMNYMIVKEIWEWNDRKAVGAKCYKCPMVRNSFCPPCGNVNAKILFLGMCPGEVEIREGRPFAGPAGHVLDDVIVENGADRDTDFRVTNACLCRPVDENGRNADPSDIELDCCSERLWKEIREMQPKVVVALGKVAYKALSGESASITNIAGSKIEMDGFVCIPTLHPASTLYGDDGGRKRDIIKQSIRTALEVAGV